MKTILFVCTGNVCRSPMAEGLFRHAVKGRGDFCALSAGVGAIDGQPPSAYAVHALRELGIDISQQRSRMLTAELVNQADYIFGMTHGHVDAVNLLYPQAVEKTFLLREFDDTLDVFEKDISDPIGGTLEVYLECRDQIEQGIASMLKFIDQTFGGPVATASREKAVHIAMGADHAGYELKEALRQHLETRGLKVVDFGANSTVSSDYPDFARAVAHAVAEQKSDLGLLVCGTGVGMSIAANKVPGVRAALVFDEKMAALARNRRKTSSMPFSTRFSKAGVTRVVSKRWNASRPRARCAWSWLTRRSPTWSVSNASASRKISS